MTPSIITSTLMGLSLASWAAVAQDSSMNLPEFSNDCKTSFSKFLDIPIVKDAAHCLSESDSSGMPHCLFKAMPAAAMPCLFHGTDYNKSIPCFLKHVPLDEVKTLLVDCSLYQFVRTYIDLDKPADFIKSAPKYIEDFKNTSFGEKVLNCMEFGMDVTKIMSCLSEFVPVDQAKDMISNQSWMQSFNSDIDVSPTDHDEL